MIDPQHILKELRNGKEAAFRQLFYAHYDPLYRHAFKYLNDSQVAEEMVQDAFVNIWENRQKIEIRTSLEGYLFTSVRNLCLNYLKSKYARSRTLTVELSTIAEEANEADHEPVSDELRARLAQGLAQLPEKCRIIFNLSRNGGMTYQEIADELGISKETVKTQIKVALHKLRAFLRDYWEACVALFCWNF